MHNGIFRPDARIFAGFPGGTHSSLACARGLRGEVKWKCPAKRALFDMIWRKLDRYDENNKLMEKITIEFAGIFRKK